MPFLAATLLASLLDAGSAAAAGGLGHPSFRVREAAHAAADKFGPFALPALRRVAVGPHAEAADRATDLIDAITRREDNARRLAPTLVRLDRADTPVGVVLADLERQSGYRFLLPGPSAKQTREQVVTVRTPGPVPFWTAVGLIADAANLSVVGVGAPLPNANTLGRYSPSSYTPPPPPPTGPVEGFVPAVEDDQRAAAERQAWQKFQDAKAKTAADMAAVEKMIAGLTKQAEKAVGLPGAVPAKPAPMPAPAAAAPPVAVIGFGTAVYLAPRSAAAGRTVVSGAVTVEVGTVPTAVLPDFPRDVLPLTVTLTPEPKLGVQKVTDIRVTKAVTADGRVIQPLMVDPITQLTVLDERNGLAVRFQGGGRVFLQRGQGNRLVGPPPPPQAVLRLIAPAGDPPTSLAELSGVAVGTLRSDIGEAAFVTDLKGAQTVTGEGGTTIRAVVTGPDDEGKYAVDLTVTYPFEKVIPAAAEKDEPAVAAVGKVRLPKGLDPSLALDDCLHWGVVVTDDQRRPCQMVRQSTGRSRVIRLAGGDSYYMHTGRYLVRPDDDDPRPPARVSFYAAWPIPVEVPFTLTNVPVTAGTGAK